MTVPPLLAMALTTMLKPSSLRFLGPVLAGLLSAGALTLAAPAPAAAQAKIAVIDVRRAMLETEEGLRVQATLKKLLDARSSELDQKRRSIQAEKDTLEKDAQAGKIPQKDLQKRAEKLQENFVQYQQAEMEVNREMQKRELELTGPIQQRLFDIIRRIAAQDGYEMILDKPAVPYFRGDLELTDKAIQMYNSGQGAAPAPAKPAAGAPAAPAPAAKPAAAPKK